ncbi:hypothetical protein BGZ73_006644 [Actinomortierella ambigua]|nr:hypothetical protein BGZ73_006644 [Actinomortierella ambigua]
MPIHENPVVLSVPEQQGLPAGTRIRSFILQDEPSCPGMACQVMTLGATLTHLWVPDRQMEKRDIIVGFDDLTAYRTQYDPYFGASVGRIANRIGNGKFSLPGDPSKVYQLDKNNDPHSLHGGLPGFSHKNWSVVATPDDHAKSEAQGASITFRVVSDHLDQGFPGKLAVECTYTLVDGSLEIVYRAILVDDDGSHKAEETIVSLTNHAYFNLNGVPPPLSAGSSGTDKITNTNTCVDHLLRFENIDHYLETDATSLPTGTIKSLNDPPAMNFSVPLYKHCRGYDHFFVVQQQHGRSDSQHSYASSSSSSPPPMTVVANITSPDSGIHMTVSTTEPGFQLYTANFVELPPNQFDAAAPPDGKRGKAAGGYGPHAGFCVETSRFPDAVHHPAWIGQVLLSKQQAYYARTRFTFGRSI